MTDEPASETVNPYEELKAEMVSQMNDLRTAFDSYKEEKEKELTQLKEDNKNLQRALIRETFSPVAAPEPEQTEEQRYKEKIIALAERASHKMKEVI